MVVEEVDFKRTPITVKFEIPYFTVSGIQVRYLKVVEKSGYQALPWVRYITQNGGILFSMGCAHPNYHGIDYQLRLPEPSKGGNKMIPI